MFLRAKQAKQRKGPVNLKTDEFKVAKRRFKDRN